MSGIYDGIAIQEWWASPTQAHIKRPYSANIVASLRDVFPDDGHNGLPHSNEMALKLRAVFERAQQGQEINLTTSANDKVSLRLMVEAGFESAYVSSGAASKEGHTSDFTYEVVPKNVKALNASIESTFSLPIIADAASGHGSHAVIMKLIKLFVQSGAAGWHIDDSLEGSKRKNGQDWEDIKGVVVPTNEYLRRLTAAKLQLDIMGSEAVSIARSDSTIATHITSTIDPRDRPFILGATVPRARDLYHSEGSSDRAEWRRQAQLKTLDGAFRDTYPELWDQFESKTKQLNTSEAVLVAHDLAPKFYWSAEAARTSEGWYHYLGGTQAALKRAAMASDIADVVWPCTQEYHEPSAVEFAQEFQKLRPGRWMGYNIPTVAKENGIRDIAAKLSSLGYVWLFVPSTIPSARLNNAATMQAIKENGVYGYLDVLSKKAVHHADGTSEEWWWKVMGKFADTAGNSFGRSL